MGLCTGIDIINQLCYSYPIISLNSFFYQESSNDANIRKNSLLLSLVVI